MLIWPVNMPVATESRRHNTENDFHFPSSREKAQRLVRRKYVARMPIGNIVI